MILYYGFGFRGISFYFGLMLRAVIGVRGCIRNVGVPMVAQQRTGMFDSIGDIINQAGGAERIKDMMGKEYEGSSNCGLISVVVKGDDTLGSVRVDDEILKKDTVTVGRAIQEAVNAGLKTVSIVLGGDLTLSYISTYYEGRNKWPCSPSTSNLEEVMLLQPNKLNKLSSNITLLLS